MSSLYLCDCVIPLEPTANTNCTIKKHRLVNVADLAGWYERRYVVFILSYDTPADSGWSCEGAQTSYAAEKKTEENDCREHAGTFLRTKVFLFESN
jgi:hypothetical protein